MDPYLTMKPGDNKGDLTKIWFNFVLSSIGIVFKPKKYCSQIAETNKTINYILDKKYLLRLRMNMLNLKFIDQIKITIYLTLSIIKI